jgi:hypothetical protein
MLLLLLLVRLLVPRAAAAEPLRVMRGESSLRRKVSSRGGSDNELDLEERSRGNEEKEKEKEKKKKEAEAESESTWDMTTRGEGGRSQPMRLQSIPTTHEWTQREQDGWTT